jgi:hypothetical protein
MWTKWLVYSGMYFHIWVSYLYLVITQLNGSGLCWRATCQGYLDGPDKKVS